MVHQIYPNKDIFETLGQKIRSWDGPMTRWLDDRMIRWPEIWMTRWPDDRMARRPYDFMTRRPDGQKTIWSEVRLARSSDGI